LYQERSAADALPLGAVAKVEYHMPTTITIQEEITARIIEAIERGQIPPWRRRISDPENSCFPTRAASRKPFVGVDALILNMSATRHDFHSKFWGSEPEWAYLYSKVSGDATILADGAPVFNGDQLFVSPGSAAYRSRRRRTPVTVDYAPAEAVIATSGAKIRHRLGLEAAYHFPPADYIVLPMRQQFLAGPGGLPGYYDSLFHELAHFSEPRLGWEGTPDLREFRAEIAAPFMASQLGLPVVTDMKMLLNHGEHLAQWVTAMKADPILIVQIAADACEAVAYLLSLGSS
jgi:antirestriction protein ArdC